MKGANIGVSIPSYALKDGTTFFVIMLKKEGSEECWSVEKRYSEFSLLQSELKKVSKKVPKLPGKTIMKAKSAKTIEKRKDGLELFLKELLYEKELFNMKLVSDFLDLKKFAPEVQVVHPEVISAVKNEFFCGVSKIVFNTQHMIMGTIENELDPIMRIKLESHNPQALNAHGKKSSAQSALKLFKVKLGEIEEGSGERSHEYHISEKERLDSEEADKKHKEKEEEKKEKVITELIIPTGDAFHHIPQISLSKTTEEKKQVSSAPTKTDNLSEAPSVSTVKVVVQEEEQIEELDAPDAPDSGKENGEAKPSHVEEVKQTAEVVVEKIEEKELNVASVQEDSQEPVVAESVEEDKSLSPEEDEEIQEGVIMGKGEEAVQGPFECKFQFMIKYRQKIAAISYYSKLHFIAIGTLKGEILVYALSTDKTTYEEKGKIIPHKGKITKIEFIPRNDLMLSIGFDKRLVGSNLQNLNQVFSILILASPLTNLIYDEKYDLLFISNKAGNVQVYDIENLDSSEPVEKLSLKTEKKGNIKSLILDEVNRYLFCGYKDCTILCFEIMKKENLRFSKIIARYNLPDVLRCMVWRPQQKDLLIGNKKGQLKFINTLNGENYLSFSAHKGAVKCIVDITMANILLTFGKDRIFNIWNMYPRKQSQGGVVTQVSQFDSQGIEKKLMPPEKDEDGDDDDDLLGWDK